MEFVPADTRYIVNPSRKEAYSTFTVDALAIDAPLVVSKHILEIFRVP